MLDEMPRYGAIYVSVTISMVALKVYEHAANTQWQLPKSLPKSLSVLEFVAWVGWG